MHSEIKLAEDAGENGLAGMLAELVRQNLEAKPHKRADFEALSGRVAIVADDADVALTLEFERGGRLTICDGIAGIPQVTIRGPSGAIIAMSNIPLTRWLGLPIPSSRDLEAAKAMRELYAATRAGRLHVYGMATHPRMVMKLTRLMSIHG